MSRARRLGVLAIATIACVSASHDIDPAIHPPARVTRSTGSMALDRIGKRAPVLDGVDRHLGDGAGVTIYIFDGGIDANNNELRGRVSAAFDAYGEATPVCNAHGTAVAGAAAGRTLGVASRATIVDVKVIECRRQLGAPEAILAAARWTIAHHAANPGPAVANWSLLVDSNRTIPVIDSAIDLMRDAGILIVTSAGNVDRDACRLSPANSGRALVVGATTLAGGNGGARRDVRTAGTAWGDCVDLYAPGDSVLLPGPGPRGAVSYWWGTSLAAAYVTGAAALLLERNPLANPDSLAALLRHAATPGVVEENVPARRGHRASLVYIGGD